MLQARGTRVPVPMMSFNFSNIYNPSSRARPWVFSVSNRNEYQNIFLGVKRGRSVSLITNSRLCADCLENV
jgi:hypothetical protein